MVDIVGTGSIELNDSHLATFRDEVKYWSEKLGLNNIRLMVGFDLSEIAYGSFDISRSSMSGTILLSKKFNTPMYPSDKVIRTIAFHECYEITLADIKGMLGCMYADHIIEEHIHKVVRLAETLMFEPDYIKRFG